MRKTRFTETQIVGMLKEYEGGKNVELICRDAGISKATFYKWRSKYSGLEVNELARMRELEQENLRLKKMYADLSLDHMILKDVITKKGWGPVSKKSS
jgi:putative transposase